MEVMAKQIDGAVDLSEELVEQRSEYLGIMLVGGAKISARPIPSAIRWLTWKDALLRYKREWSKLKLG